MAKPAEPIIGLPHHPPPPTSGKNPEGTTSFSNKG